MATPLDTRLLGGLTITVSRCTGLKRVVMFGAQNPQVSIGVNNSKQYTKTVHNGGPNVEFNESLLFNIDCQPGDLVIIKAKHDGITDNNIGVFSLSLGQLLKWQKKKLKLQLVDPDDFDKVTGAIELTPEYHGTNEPPSPAQPKSPDGRYGALAPLAVTSPSSTTRAAALSSPADEAVSVGSAAAAAAIAAASPAAAAPPLSLPPVQLTPTTLAPPEPHLAPHQPQDLPVQPLAHVLAPTGEGMPQTEGMPSPQQPQQQQQQQQQPDQPLSPQPHYQQPSAPQQHMQQQHMQQHMQQPMQQQMQQDMQQQHMQQPMQQQPLQPQQQQFAHPPPQAQPQYAQHPPMSPQHAIQPQYVQQAPQPQFAPPVAAGAYGSGGAAPPAPLMQAPVMQMSAPVVQVQAPVMSSAFGSQQPYGQTMQPHHAPHHSHQFSQPQYAQPQQQQYGSPMHAQQQQQQVPMYGSQPGQPLMYGSQPQPQPQVVYASQPVQYHAPQQPMGMVRPAQQPPQMTFVQSPTHHGQQQQQMYGAQQAYGSLPSPHQYGSPHAQPPQYATLQPHQFQHAQQQVLSAPPVSTPAVGQSPPQAHAFDDVAFLGARTQQARLVEVRVWASAQAIHGVQCVWVAQGQRVDGPVNGSTCAPNGQQQVTQALALADGGLESLVGISGRTAHTGIEALGLLTNRGQSRRYGVAQLHRSMGSEFQLRMPHPPARVIGFHGTAGPNGIASLGAWTVQGQ